MKTFIDPNLLHRLQVGPLAPYLDAYLKRPKTYSARGLFADIGANADVRDRPIQQMARGPVIRLVSSG